ncbi:hypothetical protein OUZ56_002432 [Daphnia magna]|uniref:G-protein coupled receptors family 1 profile domain-containing protein n=1 Tax=Daphnia magna TaxID=35525 RepID=A0ABR0A653_9CRUS|nr:hypothetical protein OUZ56_002432 [Daphnia magna]
MEEHWYNLIAAVLTTIAVIGSSANLAVIIIVARNRKLWNRQCMLIINVACADFFNATFGILMPLTSSIHRQWIFGDLGCNFYAFVTTVVGTASATTLAFLALDRALKICQSTWILKLPETRLIIVVLWIYSFIVSSPPLFGWGNFILEGPGISCSVDWMSTTWNSLSYITFLFTMGFFLQILIISISYVSIHLAIRQVTSTGESQRTTVARRAERKVACMLTLMVVCYLIAWLPYALFALTKVFHAVFGSSVMLIDVNGIGGYIPALLAKTSITYNPVIYVLFNTQICRNGPHFSFNQANVGESNRAVGNTRQVTINQPSAFDLPRISCIAESQLASMQTDAISSEGSRRTLLLSKTYH